MSGDATTLKIPVSLRLPRDVVEAVDSYAHDHSLTKTDAYEHFLRLAISSKNSGDNSSSAAALSQKLDEVLSALSCWQNTPTPQTQSASQRTEASQEQEFRQAVKAIESVSKRFDAVKEAVLFGSFARKTFTENSDIDIRLILDRGQRFNLRDLSQYAKQIEQLTGREVDIITSTTINDPQIADAIATEGLTVYERKEQ